MKTSPFDRRRPSDALFGICSSCCQQRTKTLDCHKSTMCTFAAQQGAMSENVELHFDAEVFVSSTMKRLNGKATKDLEKLLFPLRACKREKKCLT